MFIQLPGYMIKISSITGVSDITPIIRDIDKEGKKEKQTFYGVALFFDGSKIEWFFEKEDEAHKVYNSILKNLLENMKEV